MLNESTDTSDSRSPTCVCLIGAGTVGRAILGEFLRSRFEVILVDASEHALEAACAEMQTIAPELQVARTSSLVNEFPTVRFTFASHSRVVLQPSIVIESVPENLPLKQSLFFELDRRMSKEILLASNTSNLKINDVFEPLGQSPRCCGLHFFMPVNERPLVEFIATKFTSPGIHSKCAAIASQLGKETLAVKDSPGFVVNRLLVPYLNQSLLMLERGVSALQLAEAASRFGMPLSPLKLMDTIGIRTAFDSGRIFWQSFPERLDPAPILPGMIKAKRLGSAFGGGFFESADTANGAQIKMTSLHPDATAVIAKYQRAPQSWTVEELSQLISIPMLIEAAEVLATGVVQDLESIELAMRGGLGYQSQTGFLGYFDELGCEQIVNQLRTYGAIFRGLRASASFIESLEQCDAPSRALLEYAKAYQSETML
jgi:3-hydroxyacyl-CoA dehydrogenase / enoyl-CoA hydratase / 3-hydroxybutyryl-CoA epimerase / enoyl-CoA isomerase